MTTCKKMETITVAVFGDYSGWFQSPKYYGTLAIPMSQYREYYAFTTAKQLTTQQRAILGIKDLGAILTFQDPNVAWWTRLCHWIKIHAMKV